MEKDEFDRLTSQIVISKKQGRGGRRHLPFVFTEQGVAMLSGVLRSKIAVKTSIGIMKAFVAMRHAFLSSAGILQRLGNVEVKQIETDKRLDTVFATPRSRHFARLRRLGALWYNSGMGNTICHLVQALYKDYLGKTGSGIGEKAEKLLHTHYHKRECYKFAGTCNV